MPAKVRKIDLSPDEWIAGTLGMTLEEEGLYTRIMLRIYSRGEGLPADPSEIAHLCGLRPQVVRRLLPKLLPKFDQTGGKLTSNRCETEIKLARNRIESARFNGAKGGKSNGLAKAGGSGSVKANYHHHQGKEERFSHKELNLSVLTPREATPPLPSQGDGAAASRSRTTKEAEVNSDDLITPEEKAAALAELHRMFDAEDKRRAASLNGHAGVC